MQQIERYCTPYPMISVSFVLIEKNGFAPNKPNNSISTEQMMPSVIAFPVAFPAPVVSSAPMRRDTTEFMPTPIPFAAEIIMICMGYASPKAVNGLRPSRATNKLSTTL